MKKYVQTFSPNFSFRKKSLIKRNTEELIKKKRKGIFSYFVIMLFVILAAAFAANYSFAAEETHDAEHTGGGEHPHYSLLHFIAKLLPDGWIPQPMQWKQPDLVLNAYFVVIFLVIFTFLGTRKLQLVPTNNLQSLFELIVESLNNFFAGVIGPHGAKYAPYVSSIFIFILCMNFLGLIPGFQAPTADLNTTIALGFTAVLGVQIIAIKENGFIGYIKHFMGTPIWLAPLQFPLHIIGEMSRALSLSIRLFGNIFGEETVMLQLVTMSAGLLLIAGKIPWLPGQLPMMFLGLLFGLIQALVFSMLTAIYIVTFLEHGEEH